MSSHSVRNLIYLDNPCALAAAECSPVCGSIGFVHPIPSQAATRRAPCHGLRHKRAHRIPESLLWIICLLSGRTRTRPVEDVRRGRTHIVCACTSAEESSRWDSQPDVLIRSRQDFVVATFVCRVIRRVGARCEKQICWLVGNVVWSKLVDVFMGLLLLFMVWPDFGCWEWKC